MSPSTFDLASLTADDFASRIGQRFSVRIAAPAAPAAPAANANAAIAANSANAASSAEPIALEVVEVTAASGKAAGRPRSSFSVIFRGPRRPLLPQGIYRLEQAAMAALDLFLVPIASDAQGTSYEAVFN